MRGAIRIEVLDDAAPTPEAPRSTEPVDCYEALEPRRGDAPGPPGPPGPPDRSFEPGPTIGARFVGPEMSDFPSRRDEADRWPTLPPRPATVTPVWADPAVRARRLRRLRAEARDEPWNG